MGSTYRVAGGIRREASRDDHVCLVSVIVNTQVQHPHASISEIVQWVQWERYAGSS